MVGSKICVLTSRAAWCAEFVRDEQNLSPADSERQEGEEEEEVGVVTRLHT